MEGVQHIHYRNNLENALELELEVIATFKLKWMVIIINRVLINSKWNFN